jgi:hypothetical protein
MDTSFALKVAVENIHDRQSESRWREVQAVGPL